MHYAQTSRSKPTSRFGHGRYGVSCTTPWRNVVRNLRCDRVAIVPTLFFETLPRSYINCERDCNENRNHARIRTFIYILGGDNTTKLYIRVRASSSNVTRGLITSGNHLDRCACARACASAQAFVSFCFSKNWQEVWKFIRVWCFFFYETL